MPGFQVNRAALHTSACFVAVFAFAGAHLPFWPLWLADWGLTPTEIGTYSALGMVARIVAGFVFPVVADRLDARRKIAALGSLGAAAVFFVQGFTDSRFVLFLLAFLYYGLLAAAFPLAEAMGGIAARRHGFDFARSRAAGSASFLATSILIGVLVTGFGSDVVRWWIILAMVFSAALAWTHPGGGESHERPRFREILGLCAHPTVLVFAFAVALGQASHATYYAFGSLHWRELGLTESTIGILWAFGVAAEVLLMATVGGRLVQRIGPENAIVGGAICGAVRWTLMCFDPTGPSLWVLQILHAGTFGLTHLGMIAFISERLPSRYAGSAQGLAMSLVGGVLMAVSMYAVAATYPVLQGASYGICALLAVLSAIAGIVLSRRVAGGRVIALDG